MGMYKLTQPPVANQWFRCQTAANHWLKLEADITTTASHADPSPRVVDGKFEKVENRGSAN